MQNRSVSLCVPCGCGCVANIAPAAPVAERLRLSVRLLEMQSISHVTFIMQRLLVVALKPGARWPIYRRWPYLPVAFDMHGSKSIIRRPANCEPDHAFDVNRMLMSQTRTMSSAVRFERTHTQARTPMDGFSMNNSPCGNWSMCGKSMPDNISVLCASHIYACSVSTVFLHRCR